MRILWLKTWLESSRVFPSLTFISLDPPDVVELIFHTYTAHLGKNISNWKPSLREVSRPKFQPIISPVMSHKIEKKYRPFQSILLSPSVKFPRCFRVMFLTFLWQPKKQLRLGWWSKHDHFLLRTGHLSHLKIAATKHRTIILATQQLSDNAQQLNSQEGLFGINMMIQYNPMRNCLLRKSVCFLFPKPTRYVTVSEKKNMPHCNRKSFKIFGSTVVKTFFGDPWNLKLLGK